MKGILARSLTVLLVAAIADRFFAGGLVKIWTIHLSQLPGTTLDSVAGTILDVSFSPDGQHLAVIAAEDRPDKLPKLFFIKTHDPLSEPRTVYDSGPVALEQAISWSPEGEVIAAPEIFRGLDPGCAILRETHVEFYDSEHVAAAETVFPDSVLLFFDTKCQEIGSWDIHGRWFLSDGSGDRHLLVRTNDAPRQMEIAVVDPINKRAINRWKLADTYTSWPRFADKGSAVCASDVIGKRGVAHCWAVGSGSEIARSSSGNIHEPIATALLAKRAILSDYGWKFAFESWQAETGSLRERILWDFGSNKEIATWKPKYQADRFLRRGVKEPYKFALSPDGTMVAEGGAGELTLYKVGSSGH